MSLGAICSIMFSAISPAVGQVKRQFPTRKIQGTTAEPSVGDGERSIRGDDVSLLPSRAERKPPVLGTKFGKVTSVSEGKGAWVLWQMEAERKNAGFRVYRMDKSGETLISGFIPGSSFTYGDQLLTGAEYNFYDPKGSLESTYTVEAVNDDGSAMRANYSVTEYVESIDQLPGGSRIKEETFAPKAGDNLVGEEVKVSSELASEMQTAMFEPNLARHREVIATPGAVRVASKAEGLIRVTRAQLQSGGFNVNSPSANWQLYMDGVELPMIIGPNGDYIEFLGKAIETLETDIRVYFLITGATAGRRIPNQTVRRPITTVQSRKYNQTFVRKDKKNYTNNVLNGATENWWGDIVSSAFVDHKFNLSGIDRTPGTRRLTISFQGFSITPHSVELTLNGTPLTNVTGAGRFPFSGQFDVPVASLIDGENTLRMRSVGAAGDLSILDKLTIEFPRGFVAIGNKLTFATENYKNARMSGFTSSNIRVFDLTYENEPRALTDLQIVQTNGTFGPVIPALRERLIYAVEGSAYGTATSVTPSDPSILSNSANTGQMILIAHPTLIPQAQAWANYRAGQGVVTRVVDVTDIYDEFSYGAASSYAIQNFLEYAEFNWAVPPSYVLLFGDAHHDPKNYDSLDLGYWNMVPARMVDTLYTETGSDEALSDFNGDGLAEIAIGRIPGRDAAAITAMLNKTIAWESSLNANSLNRGALFAHDIPDGYDFEAMSNRLMSNLPASMPKISVSRTSPTAQADIIAAVNEADGGTAQAPGANAGQYLLNYTGHGTASSWQNTGFFSSLQAPNLTNANYPSIMNALTCLNGYFMGNVETFAEAMTKAPNGGAVAVWASTGLTTPDVQEIMGARFYTKVSQGSIPRMGDLVNDAKSQVPAGADVRLSWALLGDPMLKVR